MTCCIFVAYLPQKVMFNRVMVMWPVKLCLQCFDLLISHDPDLIQWGTKTKAIFDPER